MILIPREVTAELPSPILHPQVEGDEAFTSQAVGFSPQEAMNVLSEEPSTSHCRQVLKHKIKNLRVLLEGF